MYNFLQISILGEIIATRPSSSELVVLNFLIIDLTVYMVIFMHFLNDLIYEDQHIFILFHLCIL